MRGLLVDYAGSLIMALLGGNRWRVWLFSFTVPFRGAVVCTPGRVFNLNVLLDLKEDISHLGDLILHQVLVERVYDLQPIDECCRRNALIALKNECFRLSSGFILMVRR